MKRIAVAAVISGLISPAWADDHSPESNLAEPSDWKVIVGGGVASVPRYEGSTSNRLRAVPVFEAEKGHFFAGVTRGIGYNFSDDQSIQYGVRATLAHGRRENVDVRLNGMGDINYAGELGGFVNFTQDHWYELGNVAASSNGVRAELGAGFHTRLSSSDTLKIGAVLNWGNGKYNQTYFGVSSTQALASGNVLTVYNANSGIKDYGLTANWMHSFGKSWFANIAINVKQISGSAQSSPLTMKTTMQSGAMTVGYRF